MSTFLLIYFSLSNSNSYKWVINYLLVERNKFPQKSCQIIIELKKFLKEKNCVINNDLIKIKIKI